MGKMALGLEAKMDLTKVGIKVLVKVPMRGLDLVMGATQDLVERQDQDLAVGKSQDPVAREALALALALALDLVLALATMITMMISGRTGTGIGLTSIGLPLSHLSQQLSPLIFTIVIRTTLLVHATKLASVWSTNNASESIVPLTIPQKSSSMTMRV